MSIIEKLGITAGPWYVMDEGLGNKGNFPTVYATNEDLNYVCVCNDRLVTKPIDNLKNAKLIATAPEMLEDLIESRKFYDRLPAEWFPEFIVARLTETIEKATGKSWEEIKGII